MSNEENLLRYMETMAGSFPAGRVQKGWSYENMYDFLLKEGRLFKVSGYDLEASGLNAPKQCFRNAALVAMDFGHRYVEGIAWKSDVCLPLHHAWNSRNGEAFDVTWDGNVVYFGVEFPNWYVRMTLLSTSEFGMIDKWKDEWPLLTGKHAWPLNQSDFENVQYNWRSEHIV